MSEAVFNLLSSFWMRGIGLSKI